MEAKNTEYKGANWRIGAVLKAEDARKLHYILREEDISLTTFLKLLIRNKYRRMIEEKALEEKMEEQSFKNDNSEE